MNKTTIVSDCGDYFAIFFKDGTCSILRKYAKSAKDKPLDTAEWMMNQLCEAICEMAGSDSKKPGGADMSDKFYMVAGPGPTHKRHAAPEEAEREAMRVAEKENCEAYVMMSVGIATCEKSVRYKEIA